MRSVTGRSVSTATSEHRQLLAGQGSSKPSGTKPQGEAGRTRCQSLPGQCLSYKRVIHVPSASS